MNIFEALEDHHDEMLELIKSVKNESDRFGELKLHLTVHHELEEDILYREMLKKGDEAWDEAAEMMEEHHVLEFMLRDLENFPRDHKRWPVKLHVLEEYLEHHFEEEEDDVFEEGSEVVPKSDADEMAVRFNALKNKRLECGG